MRWKLATAMGALATALLRCAEVDPSTFAEDATVDLGGQSLITATLCQSHSDCDEASVCDRVIQTCVNFIPPSVPACMGAPRGTSCQQPGGGDDPDACNGVGGCADCLSDQGCPPGFYCDLFAEICLHRPGESAVGCRASWVDQHD